MVALASVAVALELVLGASLAVARLQVAAKVEVTRALVTLAPALVLEVVVHPDSESVGALALVASALVVALALVAVEPVHLVVYLALVLAVVLQVLALVSKAVVPVVYKVVALAVALAVALVHREVV